MKLLLDENLPKRLKLDFPEFEIFTVTDMGWNGKKMESCSSYWSSIILLRY
jgi:predicted nuclease of predicted toxin-antitoxin system